jgi:dinuclear metal center YbgI/SA1388 family protein
MVDPRLADVIGVVEAAYPPALAAQWDAVGLVCGDPDDVVKRVLFAIDPVAEVVDEAIADGVQLLVIHHPLYLRGTSSVAASSAKGRVVHRLIKAGIALYVAHTNADHARPGVSDALAGALGLAGLRPLEPLPAPALDKIVTFVPERDVEKLLDALSAAGAGRLGDYVRCAWTSSGIGTFLPLTGANPAIGAVGEVEVVDERRIEMVLPRARRFSVVAALRAAHPYEEPAFDVFELASWPGEAGTGRVGVLASPMSLAQFAVLVGNSLPSTAGGGRFAGDPAKLVRTVAVCGGAGGSLLDAATAAGADAYVTSDLRHHVVSEHLADGGCAVIDMPHWATEWPWLETAAAELHAGLAASGTTVNTKVSVLPTDPWGGRIDSPSRKEPR